MLSRTTHTIIIQTHITDHTQQENLVELHSQIVSYVAKRPLFHHTRITLESGDEAQEHTLSAHPSLSERQMLIAKLLIEHMSVKRIATQLFVSENTVKKHIQNIKKALNLESVGKDFVYELKKLLENRKNYPK